MHRWTVALILVPATPLLVAIGVYYQTHGDQGNPAWVLPIAAGGIFVILAIYASDMATRVGRAILVTVALVLDAGLAFLLWTLMAENVVY